MQGGELRSSLPDARPTANRLLMPPDLSGRRAEVEGGEERPEIFPSERRQGGGCCGFPNAKSEEPPTPNFSLASFIRDSEISLHFCTSSWKVDDEVLTAPPAEVKGS